MYMHGVRMCCVLVQRLCGEVALDCCSAYAEQ